MAQELTKSGKNMVRDLLESRKSEFGKALQNNIDPGHFVRAALTMIQGNSKLLECTQASLYSSLMACAQLSLSPDGVLGQAYLVPYSGKAVLIIGYKGLRELALRTDKYRDIVARVVFEKDEFHIEYGSNESMLHIPYEGDRGEMRGAYAIATCLDGSRLFGFMWGAEIEKHRNKYSKSWKKADSMWQTAPEIAWEKTLLRRLCGNRLQLSVVARKVMAVEDKMDAGLEIPLEDDIESIDIEPDDPETLDPDKKPTGVDGLTATLNKKNGKKGNKTVDQEDSQAVDLRIVIQEKIQEIYPKIAWKNKLDEICGPILGASQVPYDLENMGREDLAKVYKELSTG